MKPWFIGWHQRVCESSPFWNKAFALAQALFQAFGKKHTISNLTQLRAQTEAMESKRAFDSLQVWEDFPIMRVY